MVYFADMLTTTYMPDVRHAAASALMLSSCQQCWLVLVFTLCFRFDALLFAASCLPLSFRQRLQFQLHLVAFGEMKAHFIYCRRIRLHDVS